MNATKIFPATESFFSHFKNEFSGKTSFFSSERPKPMTRAQLFELEQQLLTTKTILAEKEFDLKNKIEAGRIHQISPTKIKANPFQPRKMFEDGSIIALADSIRRFGILQPLTLRPLREETSSHSAAENPKLYELIAGERRLRAAKLLELAAVPCIILEADDRRSAELALIENLQRENLNMFEQAGAIASLIDIYALTQEQIARRLSVSQSYIANKLRILRLSESERELILKAGLTERHARAFLRLHDPDKRFCVVLHAAKNNLNVAQTEEYVDRILADVEHAKRTPICQKKKVIIKDIGLFFNAVEKAVSTVKDAGIDIFSQREECDEEIRWIIRIPKPDRTLMQK